MSFCTCSYKQKYSARVPLHMLRNRIIPQKLLFTRLQTEIFFMSFCTCAYNQIFQINFYTWPYKQKYYTRPSVYSLTNRNISHELLQIRLRALTLLHMRIKQKYITWSSAHALTNIKMPYDILLIRMKTKIMILYELLHMHLPTNTIPVGWLKWSVI